MELVVPNGGPGSRLYPAPGFVVAGKILLGAIRVGEITYGHHRPRYVLK